MTRALENVLKGFEQRLRHRHRMGGGRIPIDLAERLSGLINTIERTASWTAPLDDLSRVCRDIQGCTRCGLHQYRHNIVVGEGNPAAQLVFVGEGPGEEEDRQGRPFVGPAGQLLTRIIEAMNLQRQQVYIANVVKCRPPGNRIPNPEEVAACIPYLYRQLKTISPRVICALGAIAAQTLLKTEKRISQLRGRFHPWRGTSVMPTYHPSYLLRNADRKREVWEDVKKIMEVLQ